MDSRFSLSQLSRDLSTLTPQEHGFTYIDISRRPLAEGRLSGWILSAKDLNDVAGMPTSKGAKHRAYNAETSDATIAALEKQGALIVGKSATPELGLRVDTEPVDMPHPVNPLHPGATPDRKSTRLNSSHVAISYAVFCLKKKTTTDGNVHRPQEHDG